MVNFWKEESRRSSIKIAVDILKLSDIKDMTISELVKYVKVNHQQTQKYINWLVKRQLLNVVDTDPGCYHSSPKGQSLVSIMSEIYRMLSGK